MIQKFCKLLTERLQCGNYRNLRSLFFGKNFVKVTFLLSLAKEITKQVIRRNIFSVRVNFRNFHSVHCWLTKILATTSCSPHEMRLKKLGAIFQFGCFCVSIVPQFHENFHTGFWFFGVPIVAQNICLNEYMWNFAVHLCHRWNFQT